MGTRTVKEIAKEILVDWKNISIYALPYLECMLSGQYGLDGEKDVVIRFLCNAGTWRGETARRVKIELKQFI